ncbi:CPBP family intramembrane metalloprotease [bacterium]|nr:MAG: CPBP family intramembrane metalloprotease [bacterium]
MPYESLLRFAIPALLAFGASYVLDRTCAARGFLPPGFREPWRRSLAFLLVAGILLVGVFAPLGMLGMDVEPDLSRLTTLRLFQLHMMFVTVLALWFLLGFAVARRAEIWTPAPEPALPEGETVPAEGVPSAAEGVPGGEPLPSEIPPPAPPPAPLSLGRQFLAQFGFLAPSVRREIGLGVLLGTGAWVVVLVTILAVALLIVAMGGEEVLPKQPPALIPWIAGLPLAIRALISLSAGVVEETFFRGFLQPRIGIPLSTAFFVLAHFSYGQPFMLVGITLLSLIYAFLVRWRRNIWAAIAAHTLFDAVQLLIVVPSALRFVGPQGTEAAGWLGMAL